MTQEVRKSWQIAVYKTNKGLLEFQDKLKAASYENYAKIHAESGERDSNGRKRLSRIGVLVSHMANNKLTDQVTFNLSVEEVIWLYEKSIRSGEFGLFLNQEKLIAAVKNPDGTSPVSKYQIGRFDKDKNGVERKLKWFLCAEQGTAIPKGTRQGGFYSQAGSYKLAQKAMISLSDFDMFSMLLKAKRYIEAWEQQVTPVILQGEVPGID